MDRKPSFFLRNSYPFQIKQPYHGVFIPEINTTEPDTTFETSLDLAMHRVLKRLFFKYGIEYSIVDYLKAKHNIKNHV